MEITQTIESVHKGISYALTFTDDKPQWLALTVNFEVYPDLIADFSDVVFHENKWPELLDVCEDILSFADFSEEAKPDGLERVFAVEMLCYMLYADTAIHELRINPQYHIMEMYLQTDIPQDFFSRFPEIYKNSKYILPYLLTPHYLDVFEKALLRAKDWIQKQDFYKDTISLRSNLVMHPKGALYVLLKHGYKPGDLMVISFIRA